MRIEGPVNAAEVMVKAPKKRILLSAYPTAWGPKRAPLRMTESLLGTQSFHPVTERSGCRWGSHSI